MGMKTHISLTP